MTSSMTPSSAASESVFRYSFAVGQSDPYFFDVKCERL
jgi:hypothetical protein